MWNNSIQIRIHVRGESLSFCHSLTKLYYFLIVLNIMLGVSLTKPKHRIPEKSIFLVLFFKYVDHEQIFEAGNTYRNQIYILHKYLIFRASK